MDAKLNDIEYELFKDSYGPPGGSAPPFHPESKMHEYPPPHAFHHLPGVPEHEPTAMRTGVSPPPGMPNQPGYGPIPAADSGDPPRGISTLGPHHVFESASAESVTDQGAMGHGNPHSTMLHHDGHPMMAAETKRRRMSVEYELKEGDSTSEHTHFGSESSMMPSTLPGGYVMPSMSGMSSPADSPSPPHEQQQQHPTRRKKMNLTPEDKAKLRAEQSRNSSRLYRLRKKEFQQQLESHLDQLKEANDRLIKECETYRELITKLTEENNQLRQMALLQHRKYQEERRELIEKLQYYMKEQIPHGGDDLGLMGRIGESVDLR